MRNPVRKREAFAVVGAEFRSSIFAVAQFLVVTFSKVVLSRSEKSGTASSSERAERAVHTDGRESLQTCVPQSTPGELDRPTLLFCRKSGRAVVTNMKKSFFACALPSLSTALLLSSPTEPSGST